MYRKEQYLILNKFADLSDALFEQGVITTDSFTGEIGEYFACKIFKLEKTKRVTKSVDGISRSGERYQVKSKVVSNNNFNYNITNLNTSEFNYLAVVFFNELYFPIKVIRLKSSSIKKSEIKLTSSNIFNYSDFKLQDGIVSKKTLSLLQNFAKTYSQLKKEGIIRSRKVVGDIGEFYASKKLNLNLSSNLNQKGIDATNSLGLKFEIKTRRVYESGRRLGETRRLNNLICKNADYLIIVTLDRAFQCSGMWIMPFKNIINPKSAKLQIINSTQDCYNIVPSKISWLRTGEKFCGFKEANKTNKLITKKNTKPVIKKISIPRAKVDYQPLKTSENDVKHSKISNNKNSYLIKLLIWIIIITFLFLTGYALYNIIFKF
jgi:hypothetical protein